jgi:hypothetical protein
LDDAGWGFGLYDGLANKGVSVRIPPFPLFSFLLSLLITLGGWSGHGWVGLDWVELDRTGLDWIGGMGQGQVLGRYDYSIIKMSRHARGFSCHSTVLENQFWV